MWEMNYFYFKKGKTLLCVRVHPIIYFLRNLYDGIHVLSMATVLNVGASQSCNLGSPLHLFFLYISKDSKIKHLISKCQWHHLESKVSLIMRLPDVGSSESCFDWLYNNPKAYTSLNWPTVHFFSFQTT